MDCFPTIKIKRSFSMGLFNKYNIEIDPNLLDELKNYVEAENIKSTVENLIKDYIEKKKPAMSANQEKVSRNLKNWLKKENSEYRKIICSFFEAQDSDGRVLKGKMHEYCEKNECTHFVTYFSQLTNSTIQQGKIFEENKYGYVNLADDVKDMIVDFYKNVSNKDISYSAKNVNDLAEQSENVCSNKSNEMTKTKAIALLSQKNCELHSCITFASINKSSGEFWANPNPEFLKQDWSFILNDKKKRKLYLLNIPKNTFKKGDILLRKDRYMLDISLDPETLINRPSDKTDFSPYKVAEISY